MGVESYCKADCTDVQKIRQILLYLRNMSRLTDTV